MTADLYAANYWDRTLEIEKESQGTIGAEEIEPHPTACWMAFALSLSMLSR